MKSQSLVNIKNIRRENLPYIVVWVLYYAWVVVFTTWWTASPLAGGSYGTDTRMTLHSVNLIASAVFICVLKREWFAKAAIAGAVCLIAAAVTFLTAKNEAVLFYAAIFLGASLGCVNVAILPPFVFALNNTEKFYSVVFANILIGALMLLQVTGAAGISGTAFVFVMLFLSLVPAAFFKKADLAKELPQNISFVPKISKLAYLTILLNCVYAVLCKGVGKVFLLSASAGSPLPLEPIFYAGAVAGCAAYFAIYAFLRGNNHVAWNITFASFVTSMLLYLLSGQSVPAMAAFAALLGVSSTMGMINMYYILGVIGKKYFSWKYVRVSVILIGLVGGVSGIALGKWVDSSPLGAGIAAAIFSAIVMVILLALSPWLTKVYFSGGWAEDSRLSDVNKSMTRLDEYSLSKREKEICLLLLKGYTMRQAAYMLDISYPTVNTYCTSLYRKLNINSRTELLVLFKEYIEQPPKAEAEKN